MAGLTKLCPISGKEFHISELEQEIRRKLKLPLSGTSPEERLRRLLSFSNLVNLFHGTCAGTKEKMLQVFRPDAPFPVYSPPYWWSDHWEASEFGRPYDFNRPFFDQFAALQRVVPQMALSISYQTVENCNYVCGVGFCKNCYLLFNSNNDEDCCFGYTVIGCRDCVDCTSVFNCELCYDGTFLQDCYDVRHSFNCKACRSSAFLWNCIACQDCFGCVNLRHRRWCFFNEQLTQKSYQEKMLGIALDSRRTTAELKTKFGLFVRRFPQPAVRGIELEQAQGDFISRCRRVGLCFECSGLEDCFNCLKIKDSRDCLDVYQWGDGCELIYNTSRCGYQCQNIICCYLVFLGCSNLEYCMACTGCSCCFGCIGLRKKSYCILNKQYSKSGYLEVRRRIMTQMNDPASNGGRCYGEFFPSALSFFPFNDSDAMRLLPLSREEASTRGLRWAAAETAPPSRVADWSAVPDRTVDVPDSIINERFQCPEAGEPFKITSAELGIYRRRALPLPCRHWKVRLLERQALLNRPLLFQRECAKTGRPLLSSFPPEEQWDVWDNDAFEAEVSG